MINNLSGHGVQTNTINQQANKTTVQTVIGSDVTTFAATKKATVTPSTIVTLSKSTKPDEPVTYSTAGGIDKPPP